MAIEFSCGSCSARFRIPDTMAGKKIRCPKCQAVQQVPADEPEIEYQLKRDESGDDFWLQTPGIATAPQQSLFESHAPAPTGSITASAGRFDTAQEEVRRRVAVPAKALYSLGIAGIVLHGLWFVVLLLLFLISDPTHLIIFIVPHFGVFAIFAGMSYFVCHGAKHFENLDRGQFVIPMLVISMTPLATNILFPVAIPFALWGFALISDPKVRRQFNGY
ncbi:hypothetical protein [Blastopirellula marina]|uniref:Zinc finger/thioredoxin putative domain-containing protein n=1 Tax=Blastopirellula marina TaxID=124 RepID=A0A2S8GSY3_9BACT|nr:hypothetical protein [Blastopirellula marina]PQO47530.1 hypothetical protein C5Y93_02400 [Blastopirellula marina]